MVVLRLGILNLKPLTVRLKGALTKLLISNFTHLSFVLADSVSHVRLTSNVLPALKSSFRILYFLRYVPWIKYPWARCYSLQNKTFAKLFSLKEQWIPRPYPRSYLSLLLKGRYYA